MAVSAMIAACFRLLRGDVKLAIVCLFDHMSEADWFKPVLQPGKRMFFLNFIYLQM